MSTLQKALKPELPEGPALTSAGTPAVIQVQSQPESNCQTVRERVEWWESMPDGPDGSERVVRRRRSNENLL